MTDEDKLHKSSDTKRLAQVRARDTAANGQFVYGVRTTGVFCRASCAARAAKTENIVFYDTAAEAEVAGFRPCLRCRPLAAAGLDPHAEKMQSLAAFIAGHAEEPMPLARLADRAAMSPFHLQRTFKGVLGVSPKEYHAAARLKTFKTRLREGDDVDSLVHQLALEFPNATIKSTDAAADGPLEA